MVTGEPAGDPDTARCPMMNDTAETGSASSTAPTTCCLPFGAREPIKRCISASRSRQNWENLGLMNYRFRFERTCFCQPSTISGTVEVKDGVIVDVVDARADGIPLPAPEHRHFKTIAELFTII